MLQVTVYRSTCSISKSPHSLSTGENVFLATLSQHKHHDTMDVAEIWSPHHGGWQTHHQTFEFKKKNLPSFSPKMQTPKKQTAVWKRTTCFCLCVCFLWLRTNRKNGMPLGHTCITMGSWRCEKPRDPLDSTSKMTRWIGRENRGRGGWFTRLRRWKCLFLFSNTQVMPILSLKSLMFFSHLPCFRAILNLFQMPCFSVRHSPLYLDIVFTLEYLLTSLRRQSHHAWFWRVWRAPKPGIATLSGTFWQLKDRIGFCLGGGHRFLEWYGDSYGDNYGDMFEGYPQWSLLDSTHGNQTIQHSSIDFKVLLLRMGLGSLEEVVQYHNKSPYCHRIALVLAKKVVGILKNPRLNAIYTWYISGIYCQLADYILPSTFYKNLKDPLILYLKRSDQPQINCHE